MKESDHEPTIVVIKDAITAGVLKAFGIEITPYPEEGRVNYHARGNVKVLET